MKRPPLVLAVDGGNTTIDAALVDGHGRLLGRALGAGASFAPGDEERSLAMLRAAVGGAPRAAGLGDGCRVEAAALCLAGDDLPADDRRLKALLHREDLAARLTLRNDVAAVLRAGTERGWGVALVCGTGMNGMGRARDGRVVRFASLGELSGDAGGGSWLGRQAVRAAVRARDGRDPDTVLRSDVPAALGCKDVAGVLAALHTGALPAGVLAGLAPLVLHAAATGDEVSRGLVETQARELAAMAVSALRRLRLLRAGAEVVLAGGVVRGGGEPFVALVRDAVLAAAPSARVGVLQVAPVAGAALLALDELGLAAAVAPAVRDALADPLSFE